MTGLVLRRMVRSALCAWLLRLGTAHGEPAQSTLVPPPAWLPGQPGHAAFAALHRTRPTLAWRGARDGRLRAFDPGSGKEVFAYLPRARHGKGASRDALAAPCPHPEAADVLLAPDRWRTVLLCGLPPERANEPGTSGDANRGGVLALDITGAQPPPSPLWEVIGSGTLPLAPAGPVRALALAVPEGQRWYAMTLLAATPENTPRDVPMQRAGLALLPLDKGPHAPWQGRHAILRLHLPDAGCGIRGANPALLAASVLPAATGTALAAYAVDGIGRLWRFELSGTAPWHDGERRARCMHRTAVPASGQAAQAAPVIIGAAAGHLVIYGSGNSVTAVVDGVDPGRSDRQGVLLARIAAEPQANGVVLRRQRGQPGTAGWRLPLPNPGERLERFLPAGPGYLAMVTRTPDTRQRAYLIHAHSGESVVREQAGGPLVHASTGRAVAGHATVQLGREPLAPQRAVRAGITSDEAVALTLWSLEDGIAVLHNRTVASRRSGRLRWRELIRTDPPA